MEIKSDGKRKQKRIEKYSKTEYVLEYGILQEVKFHYLEGLSPEEQAYLDFFVLGVRDKLDMSKPFKEVRAINYVNKKLYDAIKDSHDEWVSERKNQLEQGRAKAKARRDIELISPEELSKRFEMLSSLVKEKKERK